MTRKEKMEEVRYLLKQIEESVFYHLEDCDDHEIDLHAIDYVKSALKVFEEFYEEKKSNENQ